MRAERDGVEPPLRALQDIPETIRVGHISLDGYGAAEGWPGFWGMEGAEYLAWLEEDGGIEHTALMGATTYRLMSGYAAEMPDDPGLAALTAMPKVVFSSTLKAHSRGPTLSWSTGNRSRLCRT